ncbi:class I SAM-dependent methyltransferase [Patescibacteria group bacterium]|nr:class I SAM-dependent methyltransferase [Patescibacteria group bacterium]
MLKKTTLKNGLRKNISQRKLTNWNRYRGSFIFPQGVFKGYKKFVKQIKENWPEEGGKILELGSGSGRTSFWISDILPVSEIVLVDSNEKILEKSKRFFSNKNIPVRFIKKDIRHLDLKEKFNLIHNSGVLEHFLPKEQGEIIKVHKKHIVKNGWVISYVPTPDLSYRFWRSIQELLGVWRFPDEKPLVFSELSKLFQKEGFKILGSNKVWKWYLTEVGILAKF